jgi:serine/alanine adding enzyme
VISICELASDTALWDRNVEDAHDGTVYHLAGWRDVMADVFGHECRYLIATDDTGEWRGLLPLVRVKNHLFGHYLMSMPFLNAGGPLGDEAGEQALVRWAIAESQRSRVDLLELRSRKPVPGELRQSNRKITVHLGLPRTAQALSDGFPSKLRSQIRRARKEGLETRFGLDQREAFYDVFARNMRALGTPVLPARFFERIADRFAGRVQFAVVYHQETPVASGCGFVWRDEFELHWASSLREYSRIAPNMHLYSTLMEHAIGRGVRVFNFGRCSPGSGTHAFKRQWGGTDVALPWAQWSRQNVTATPSPNRPLFRAATACWRRLPLAVTNRVGPVLAGQIP